MLEGNAPGGQINFSPLVENYPGLPSIPGSRFSEDLLRQAEELGVELEYESVTGFRTHGNGFQVTTDCALRECRALVLATGVQHRTLGLPGEEELVGQGVSYCAVCDGPFYAGKATAVVGGGDTAPVPVRNLLPGHPDPPPGGVPGGPAAGGAGTGPGQHRL